MNLNYRLGGTLRCEEKVPFKKDLIRYLNQQARFISEAKNIDLRLNTEVTPELAASIAPDVIIAALGARPVVPDIKGIEGKNVKSAEDVYAAPEKAGKKVVILGGGLVGTELAIFLAQTGRDVTILEIMPELNNGGNVIHAIALDIQIRNLGIKVALSTRAMEINEKGVMGMNNSGHKLYEAETVIYAVGQTPLRKEADALRFCAPEFYQIGDCLVPNNIQSATNAAYFTVRNIGRI